MRQTRWHVSILQLIAHYIMSQYINEIHARLEPLRAQLLQHPVYASLKSLEDLQQFMEFHAYAVWDFMSLVKALQAQLTCVSTPWLPSVHPTTRRLINDIVLGEETDEAPDGSFLSHYELYLLAMKEAGASTTAIENLLRKIAQNTPINEAIDTVTHPAVAQFLRFTFDTIATGKTHCIAAAFTFGREDLIPDMFRAIVHDIDKNHTGKLETLRYYLDRHIELDEDEHGPMALRMMQELCGSNTQKWKEATEYATQALEVRLLLWNAIHEALTQATVIQN